jgi:hypothetical protein
MCRLLLVVGALVGAAKVLERYLADTDGPALPDADGLKLSGCDAPANGDR